jgi:hypothetical protein
VYLRGGLGNQLFQYAAGLYFSEASSSPLEIRTDLLPLRPDVFLGAGRWPCQLSGFQHSGYLRSAGFQPRTGTNFFSKALTIRRHLLGAIPGYWAKFGLFTDPADGDFDKFIECARGRESLVLDGYFQTTLFALPHRDRLRVEILGQESGADDTDLGKSIAVHIRLGDNLWQKPNLLDRYRDFYQRAVDQASERLGTRPSLAVFSDQEELITEVLGEKNYDWRLVKTNPESPVEALRLIAACGGLIAPASTFSWWGAFLQRKWDRVFIKTPWNISDLHFESRHRLIPAEWDRVSGDF